MIQQLRLAIAGLVFVAAALASAPAAAFCGYFVGSAKGLYNNATQVVLMRDGTTTVVSMRPDYTGPIEDFALVVPVPQVLGEKDVLTRPRTPLDAIDALTSPRLVEYREADPCKPARRQRKDGIDSILDTIDTKGGSAPSVKVVATFQRDEYNIVILDANDSTALEKWLTKNGYKQPKGAAAALAPYIQGGFYFFAAKVDAKKVQFAPGGKAALSPLQFRYSSDTFQLPIRLGMLNAAGKQDLIVFVIAKDRYEVANRKNVFIPTNLDVSEARLKDFATWYDGHFSAQLKSSPTAVVTEYAWPINMKCDPCPDGMSQLTDRQLSELGGELMGSKVNPRTMVVTRLHARYGPEGGTSDLVFQKATPVSGGREVYVDGKLEQGATNASVNSFQGRFAIRHKWTGAIACKDPKRGVWSGSVRPFTPWGPLVAPPAAASPPGLPRALRRADIKGTMKRYASRISNCGTTQNKDGMTGTIRVRFSITPSGRTRDVRVTSATFADTDVGRCVAKVVDSMTFPATSATNDVPVHYPFVIK